MTMWIYAVLCLTTCLALCMHLIGGQVLPPGSIVPGAVGNGTPAEGMLACEPRTRPERLTRPGDIDIPRFPNGSYLHNQHCVWHIGAPSGQVVRLQTSPIDFFPIYPCYLGNLTVYDGGPAEQSDDFVDRYCGRQDAQLIYTSDRYLTLTYKSGVTGDGRGFTASFTFINLQEEACGPADGKGHAYMNWTQGGLSSPSWPYPNTGPAHCLWKIIPQPYMDLRLSFPERDWSMGDLSDRDEECSGVRLRVIHGEYPGLEGYHPADTRPAGRGDLYCGPSPPVPVGARGTPVYLEYQRPPGGSAMVGFRARFDNRDSTEIACGTSRPVVMDWVPGTIRSPPTEKSLCRWRIAAPVGFIIKIAVDHFDLADCTNCGCAKLSVYDGSNEYQSLIGVYCRDGWGQTPLITGGNYSYLIYESYELAPRTGFTLNYSFVEIADEACGSGSPVVLTNTRGTIYSPGYGREDYPNNANCAWEIRAELGQVVRVEFHEMAIEMCPACRCDALSLYNGHRDHGNTSDSFIGSYCGDARPPPIQTTISGMVIAFRSDTRTRAKGFRLQYVIESLADIACGAHQPGLMRYQPGVIFSKNYGSDVGYPANSACTWLITAPIGQIVELDFHTFDVEYGVYCEFDYLRVYNSGNRGREIIGKYCGSKLPPTLRSSSNQLYVEFISNNHIQKTGFHMSYSFNKHVTGRSHISVIPAVVCGAIGAVILVAILVVYIKCPHKFRSVTRRSSSRPDQRDPRNIREPGRNSNYHGSSDVIRRTLHHVPPPLPLASQHGGGVGRMPPGTPIKPPSYDQVHDYPPPAYDDGLPATPATPGASNTPGIHEAAPPYSETDNYLHLLQNQPSDRRRPFNNLDCDTEDTGALNRSFVSDGGQKDNDGGTSHNEARAVVPPSVHGVRLSSSMSPATSAYEVRPSRSDTTGAAAQSDGIDVHLSSVRLSDLTERRETTI